MKLKTLLLPMLFLIFSCDTPEEPDCAGISGGDAVEDACGVCEGDGSNCIFDIDGNVYETIQIGDQLWMAENLKVTHYNNGSEIPTGYTDSEWAELETDAYAVYPTDDDNASQSTCGDDCADVYGNLYNWYVVDDSRGLCMDGWHVPSDEEYTVLKDYLGGGEVAGGKMKETGTEHWNSPNTGATNESGFTGLPAGYRDGSNGNYGSMGSHGAFWSSSEDGSNDASYRVLSYNHSSVTRDNANRQGGFSIRCLGD